MNAKKLLLPLLMGLFAFLLGACVPAEKPAVTSPQLSSTEQTCFAPEESFSVSVWVSDDPDTYTLFVEPHYGVVSTDTTSVDLAAFTGESTTLSVGQWMDIPPLANDVLQYTEHIPFNEETGASPQYCFQLAAPAP